MSALHRQTMLKAALFRAITRAERRQAGVLPFEPRDRGLEALEDKLLHLVSNLPGRQSAVDEAPLPEGAAQLGARSATPVSGGPGRGRFERNLIGPAVRQRRGSHPTGR